MMVRWDDSTTPGQPKHLPVDIIDFGDGWNYNSIGGVVKSKSKAISVLRKGIAVVVGRPE